MELILLQKITVALGTGIMLFSFAMNLYSLKLQRQNNLQQNKKMIELTEQILEELKRR